eukprot:10930906-Lingulodinium_polyedra.AAC.1
MQCKANAMPFNVNATQFNAMLTPRTTHAMPNHAMQIHATTRRRNGSHTARATHTMQTPKT